LPKRYNPYKIGRRLFKDGLGLSDVATAVRNNEDIGEALRGYEDTMIKYQAQETIKKIKSQLGYSRIGLKNT
jgi:hypothetical protein